MTHTPRYDNDKRLPFFLGCNCLSIAAIVFPPLLLLAAIPFLESAPVGTLPEWATPVLILPIFLPCLGLVALLFSGIPTYLYLRNKRAINRLLKGEGVLAQWQYDRNLGGQTEEGYVYIGEKGIFTQGNYRAFKYPGGKLVAVQYEEGHPGKLSFAFGSIRKDIGYTEVGAGNFSLHYDAISVPVPDAHTGDAQMIVEQLTPKDEV